MEQIISQLVSNTWSIFIGAFSLLLLWGGARVLEWTWLKPRRMEQELRKQGLHGTVYRFLEGDMKENNRLNKEACTEPMPLSHDIVPRISPLLHNTMKEYGKMSFTWFGTYPRVTISDPEMMKQILSSKFGHFEKPNLMFGRVQMGVLNYEGEKWAKHRRILNPAFHVEKLKRMLPAFSTCCNELVERWESSVGPNGSFELDVWPEMKDLTGDVISRAAFSSSCEEGRRIFQLQGELAECFMKAFRTMHIPFHMFLPTANNKRMKEINKEIATLLRGIVRKKERAIQNGEATKDDLLGLLLESNMSEMAQNGESSPNLGMTTEEVIGECRLFYFAGQETTSVLLTWTMIVLSMHPEWQEKAREEVLQHFGREKLDYDGLSRLKIVTMILHEVLRLYPPAVEMHRRTYKTTQLGDVIFPPGVLLALPIIHIHHDPNIWGPDSTEFKPTRFAEGISKATKTGHTAFFPFSWGPRVCIGQNFALLEAKMGLSVILQRFRFELSKKYQHAPYKVVTLQPKHGAPIKLHKI